MREQFRKSRDAGHCTQKFCYITEILGLTHLNLLKSAVYDENAPRKPGIDKYLATI